MYIYEFDCHVIINRYKCLEPRRSEKCTVNDTQNIVPRKRIILINESSDNYLFELVFYGSLR